VGPFGLEPSMVQAL